MVDRNTAGVSVFRPRFWGDKMCGVSAQEPLAGRDAPTACLSHSRQVQHVSGPVGAVPDGWVPSLVAVVQTL